jgi:uroporphyrinogen III methyltransferase/synthase
LLQSARAEVDNVPVYTTVTVKNDSGALIEKIKKGEIHWLTFASPSSVRAFFEQIPADLVNSGNTKIASIGPVTSEQLKQLGIKVDVQAMEHTTDGLLDAIEKTYK